MSQDCLMNADLYTTRNLRSFVTINIIWLVSSYFFTVIKISDDIGAAEVWQKEVEPRYLLSTRKL